MGWRILLVSVAMASSQETGWGVVEHNNVDTADNLDGTDLLLACVVHTR